jgi:hypothetical protein
MSRASGFAGPPGRACGTGPRSRRAPKNRHPPPRNHGRGDSNVAIGASVSADRQIGLREDGALTPRPLSIHTGGDCESATGPGPRGSTRLSAASRRISPWTTLATSRPMRFLPRVFPTRINASLRRHGPAASYCRTKSKIPREARLSEGRRSMHIASLSLSFRSRTRVQESPVLRCCSEAESA